MIWVLFALTTALALSTADALSKRALGKTDDLVIVWVREGYALPFLALALFFVPIPALDPVFWITVCGLVPLEVISLVLYIKAIRLSPLSLTVPFLAMSPVFIIFIAFAFLGEVPDKGGVIGVILITAGAYTLNASASKEGILGPIRAILKEPGSILMLIVAVIYSVTSTLGKVAVQHSSPVFFGFFYPLTLTIVLTIFLGAKGKLGGVFERPAVFLPIGLCTATMVITHFIAISMTQVAYMIAVKRLSLVFSVVYGWAMFKEEKIKERLLGSAIMLAGVASILIF